MYKMLNTIQTYAWGSHTFIQKLSGDSSLKRKPAAELWMGTHPMAPSILLTPQGDINLDEYIKQNPEQTLGSNHEAYGDNLPFLFKVLAAEKALSIQAHPSRPKARKGFEKEEALHVPLNSPLRNYKDKNHKPELICALTEFHAMCGFRPFQEICQLFHHFGLGYFLGSFAEFCASPSERSLRSLFSELLRSDYEKKTRILDHIKIEIDQIDIFLEVEDDATKLVRYWIGILLEQFPDDLGVLSPLFLNLITLKPLQAIYLPAGVLHAYLKGAGMEIMANSDNVLRGGLTPKYIDVPELLSSLNFNPHKPKLLSPRRNQTGVKEYKTPSRDFAFAHLEVKTKAEVEISFEKAQIIFCYSGSATLNCGGQTLVLNKGESVFIPAVIGMIQIEGNASIFIGSY